MLKTAALIGAPILAALAIAACGGGGSNTNTSTTSPSAAGNSGSGQATSRNAAAAHSAMLKFAQCMRASGVPSFPDPGSGSGGGLQIAASRTAGSGRNLTINGVPVNGPAFQSAMQKCRKDLPHGPPLSAAQVTKIKAQAIQFAKCMRAHGVPNFPDPQITAGPSGRGLAIRLGGGPNSGINPQSPAFQQARQKCGSFLGGAKGFGFRTQAPAGGA